MHVSGGYNRGSLAILLISLAVYGGGLLNKQHLLPELSLPWGNQGPGMTTVAVSGTRDADGIYFLPEGTDTETLLKIIRLNRNREISEFRICDGAAIAISVAGGVVKIGDMPAIKRLALGLPIDLNSATAEDLSLIPGIGERMAGDIVQRRLTVGNFTVLSDLTAISGIKEKKLIGLKKYLMIGSTC
jgi:hypothetical protein